MKCQPSAPSTAKEDQLPALDWKNIQHRPIVYVLKNQIIESVVVCIVADDLALQNIHIGLKSQIISYNADHHTFDDLVLQNIHDWPLLNVLPA